MFGLNNRYDITIYLTDEEPITEKFLSGHIVNIYSKEIQILKLKHDPNVILSTFSEKADYSELLISTDNKNDYETTGHIGRSYNGGKTCSDLFIYNVKELKFPQIHIHADWKKWIEKMTEK